MVLEISQWPDSNQDHRESEVTALPTQPQPRTSEAEVRSFWKAIYCNFSSEKALAYSTDTRQSMTFAQFAIGTVQINLTRPWLTKV